MPDELDPLDPLHKDSFIEGQESLARKVSSQRFIEQLKDMEDVGLAAAETFDRVDQLAQDGDPYKKRLAATIKNRIVGVVEQAMTGRPAAEEARSPDGVAPFLEGSSPPSTSLPGSTSKSLPHTPSELPKKKRGRPPKAPKS